MGGRGAQAEVVQMSNRDANPSADYNMYSENNFQPSAPPREDPQYPPPTYQSVANNGNTNREAGRSTLTRSLAYAGMSSNLQLYEQREISIVFS